MKQKKSKTLMFQLVLCFSAILIVVTALLVISWTNSQREKQTSSTISALTTPYVRLYAGIDKLSNSITAMVYSKADQKEHAETVAAVAEANQSLLEVLNKDGYNRTSIDLYYTIQQFLKTYENVLQSYESRDYSQAQDGIEQLQSTAIWIRDYLKQVYGDINEKQNSLLLYSEKMRGQYYSLMIILSCAIFLLCLMVLVLTAHRFVVPIQTLCKNVTEFRLSDDINELHERGIPCRSGSLQEIRTLATAIYSMQDTVLDQYTVEKNIELLRTRLNEEALHTANIEKELQETRLKALQAQINPHFYSIP